MKENMRYIYGKIADKRGVQSENNALRAFQRREDVVAVRKTNKWSPEDMAGVDIVADIMHQEPESGVTKIETVKVQVKSSEHAIVSFVRKKRKKLGFSTEDQVRDTFMLINGQLPHATIDESIDQQVESMGIIEPAFQRPEPGKEIVLFTPPQKNKVAA